MWMAMMSMLVARCGNVANWFLSSWSELMRNRWDATIVMIGERLMSPTMGTVRIVAGPRFPMKVFNTKQWRDPKRQQSNWRSWDKFVMAFSRIKHICSGLYNRIREIGNFQRRLGDSDRSINRLMMESSTFSSTFDSRIWLHLSDGTMKKFLLRSEMRNMIKVTSRRILILPNGCAWIERETFPPQAQSPQRSTISNKNLFYWSIIAFSSISA